MSIFHLNFTNTVLSALVVVLTTYSHIILRLNLNKFSKIFSSSAFNFSSFISVIKDFWVISSVLAFGCGFLCWSIALLNNINAAKVYPIVTSLTILSVWLLNIIIFHDNINYYNGVGVIAIIIGVFLLLMK